jgi:hypothetical protein
MSQRGRLLTYLLLNVLVSACVVSAVLFWYDQVYLERTAPVSPSTPAAALETAYLDDLQGEVEIVSVIGAGSLSAETVLIRYNGDDQLTLTGWRLQNGRGDVFTFPQLTLYKGGAVQVHSRSGNDTVVDLFWGRSQSAWSSGEVASLLDSQGALRALYRIP